MSVEPASQSKYRVVYLVGPLGSLGVGKSCRGMFQTGFGT